MLEQKGVLYTGEHGNLHDSSLPLQPAPFRMRITPCLPLSLRLCRVHENRPRVKNN